MRNPIDTFERWLIQSDGLGYADVAMYREFYKGEHDIRLSKRQETRLGITSGRRNRPSSTCSMISAMRPARLPSSSSRSYSREIAMVSSACPSMVV